LQNPLTRAYFQKMMEYAGVSQRFAPPQEMTAVPGQAPGQVPEKALANIQSREGVLPSGVTR